MKLQRNDQCHCNSGKKYKKCCLLVDSAFVNYDQDPYERHFIVKLQPEIDDECREILEQLEKDGNIAKAKKIAQKLYEEHPRNRYVNFLQGCCSLKEEDHSQAINYFEEAVKIFPYFAEAFYNLGQVYTKEVRIPAAVACYKRIIKIEKTDSVLSLLAQKELENLENIIKEIQGLTLNEYIKSQTTFDKAFANLKEKNFELAIALFERVLSIDPNHVQTYGNMALSYSGLGKNSLALQYLDKAISLDPNYAPALLNRLVISQLNEGESFNSKIQEVHYYKDGMKAKHIFG